MPLAESEDPEPVGVRVAFFDRLVHRREHDGGAVTRSLGRLDGIARRGHTQKDIAPRGEELVVRPRPESRPEFVDTRAGSARSGIDPDDRRIMPLWRPSRRQKRASRQLLAAELKWDRSPLWLRNPVQM